MRRIVVSVIVAAVGIGLVATTGSAQNPGQGQGQGRTIVLFEKEEGGSFRFVDAKPFTRLTRGEPRKISVGDALVLGIPMFADPGATQRAGRLRVHCLAMNASRRFTRVSFLCDGIYKLVGGTIAVSALVRFPESSTSTFQLAVIGGTGAYEGASGQVTIEDPAEGPSKNTIHLVTG
jgi:hypothetical protein